MRSLWRSRVSARFRSVISRATAKAPMIVPAASRTGEIDNRTSTREPSLRSQTCSSDGNDSPRLMLSIKRGETLPSLEQVWLRKDGSRVDVRLSISPVREAAGTIIGAFAVARDITERKRAETRLRQSERMASIGALAAGLGHDMNNVLLPVRAR